MGKNVLFTNVLAEDIERICGFVQWLFIVINVFLGFDSCLVSWFALLQNSIS